MNKTSFTYTLSDGQQEVLSDILREGNYRPVTGVEHSLIAAETPECRIVLYKSGKCLVQGRGAEDFVMFVLEPKVLRHVGVGYEEILNPESYSPHMGVDESGKGDFFGPLSVVSAYTDDQLAAKLLRMGVRDSKNISGDGKALRMAEGIRKLLHGRYSIVLVGPSAYNRLYAKLRNVNLILAWAHARAIENLLATVPSCSRAVSDQFGNKDQVLRSLMKRGRKIELVQRHRAESDVAVAAASVLARAAFLTRLRKMGEKYSLALKKGASSGVVEDGRRLVARHGAKILLETAKCHFKTTDAILASLGLDRGVLGPEGAAVSKPRLSATRTQAE